MVIDGFAPDAWRGCDIIVFSRTSADALDRYEDSEPEELASNEDSEEEEEEEGVEEEEEIESTVFLFLYSILLHCLACSLPSGLPFLCEDQCCEVSLIITGVFIIIYYTHLSSQQLRAALTICRSRATREEAQDRSRGERRC
jgi:hypothetical protein